MRYSNWELVVLEGLERAVSRGYTDAWREKIKVVYLRRHLAIADRIYFRGLQLFTIKEPNGVKNQSKR